MLKTMTVRVTIAAILAGLSMSALAIADTQRIDIPAGSLLTALETLAKQANVDLVYQDAQVQGLRTGGVTGDLSPHDAVVKLLQGTPLQVRMDKASGAILITTPPLGGSPSSSLSTTPSAPIGEEKDSFWSRLQLAQSDSTSASQLDATSPSLFKGETGLGDEQAAHNQKTVELEEIVVTGTNIRGVSDQFSPVNTYNRDELDRQGYASLPDLVAALPQNFGGGASGSLQSTLNNANGTGSVAVNLRGIGNDATLTLLNGRRLAPSGSFGNIADIAAVPLSAVKRVEVLTDGASAIYGADAVAGVFNIILRDDFSGAETRVGLGTSTQGGAETYSIGQTLGFSDQRARGLVSYEHGDVDAIDSQDRSVSRAAADPTDLQPQTTRDGLFLTGAVQVVPTMEISGSGYYNYRRSDMQSTFDGFTYNSRTKAEEYGAVVGAEYEFASQWHADASVSFSVSDAPDHTRTVNQATGADANLLLNQGLTQIEEAEVKVGGPIAALPGGDASIVVGTQGRREKYHGTRRDELSGQTFFDIRSDRSIGAAFVEGYLPVIASANHVPAVDRLALTAAARYEKYSDVGSSTVPKFGVIYSPVGGLNLRATYGRSFRAPRLQQLVDSISYAFLADYLDPQAPSGRSVSLAYGGGTSDLEPERSTNITAGFDLEPAAIPGLQIRVTYFNIDFENRIVTPNTPFDQTLFAFYDHPVPVIRDFTPQDVTNLINQAAFYFDLTGGASTPSDVTVLISGMPVNAARTQVEGVDFNFSYSHEAYGGTFGAFVTGTFLSKYDQQFSSLTPNVSQLDYFGQPLDWRARGGLTWSGDGVDLGAFVNYADAYLDNRSLGAPRPIASWTTVDLSTQVRLNRGSPGDPGTTLSFAVRNVLDRDPPNTSIGGFNNSEFFNFDPANADATGRFVSLQLTHRW